MFPALSHQLHTSPLCITPAALREGGVEGEGRRRGWESVRMLCGFMLEETHYAHFQVHYSIFGLQLE